MFIRGLALIVQDDRQDEQVVSLVGITSSFSSVRSGGPMELSTITPSLLIGPKRLVRSVADASRYGLSHVLNVSDSTVFFESPQPRYLFIPMCDYGSSSIRDILQQATPFFSESQKDGRILICCQGGMNRSCSIAIGLLMTVLNYSLHEAITLVRQQRPLCCPHESYRKQLVDLEGERGASSATPESFGPTLQEILSTIIQKD